MSRRNWGQGFACCGCGVRALALTPPGEFGDLPYGKASNRDSRPYLRLESVRIAGEYLFPVSEKKTEFTNSS